MSDDEKFAILARAILELAQKAATTWDYDGEQITGTGVMLDLERELEIIAALAEAEPMSHFAAPQEAGK